MSYVGGMKTNRTMTLGGLTMYGRVMKKVKKDANYYWSKGYNDWKKSLKK